MAAISDPLFCRSACTLPSSNELMQLSVKFVFRAARLSACSERRRLCTCYCAIFAVQCMEHDCRGGRFRLLFLAEQTQETYAVHCNTPNPRLSTPTHFRLKEKTASVRKHDALSDGSSLSVDSQSLMLQYLYS